MHHTDTEPFLPWQGRACLRMKMEEEEEEEEAKIAILEILRPC